MVISIQQFNDDEFAAEELGRIHNGEVFVANVEGFEDEVERMREQARKRREHDTKTDAVRTDPLSYRVRNVFHRPQLSLKDELSVVRRYKPPYGIYASVRVPNADRERLLEVDLSDDVTPPQRPVDPNEVEFRSYHGPFDEDEPVYLVSIAPDGYGFYEGRENTPINGTYAFHIPESTRRELIDLCYENGFFEFDHTYITADEPEPLPSVSTGVRIGESEKWVYNYSHTAPEALQEIEDAIRDACGVEQWLDPNGESMLETIADDPQAAGPALAAFNAASDENLVTADPDEIFETVRPALSAADRTTRRNAAEIAARNCPVTDLVTNESSRQIVSDEATSTDRPNRDVTTDEAFSLFEPLLTDEDQDVRDAANRAFSLLNIGTKPESVSTLFETDDERDRTTVAVQLRELVTDRPRSFRESVGGIAAELQDGEPDARAAVAEMVQTIVSADPGVVGEVRDELVFGLEDPNEDVRNACAKTLADASVTEPLIDRLEADRASVRTTALCGLTRVARDEPAIVEEISPTIDSVLTDGTAAEREQAAALLVKLAVGTNRPESLCEHARDLLADTDTTVQTKGFRLSKRLVCVDPDLFEPFRSRVTSGFSHDSRTIRKIAFEVALEAGHDSLVIDYLESNDPAVRSSAATVLESATADESNRFQPYSADVIELIDDNEIQSSLVPVIETLVQGGDRPVEHASLLLSALEDGRDETRNKLAPVLEELVTDQPRAITDECDRLVALLESAPSTTRRHLLACLATVLERGLVDLAEHTGTIRAQFGDETYEVREEAARCGAVLCSVAALSAVLKDGDENERHTACWALERIARSEPDRVVDVLPLIEVQVAAISTDELSQLDRRAVEVVAQLADAYPEQVVPLVPELTTALSARSRFTRRASCEALAAIATEDVEAIIDAVPAIAPLLDDKFEDVQRAAMDVLRPISESYPDELRPVVPTLVGLIEGGELPVSAMFTIGHIAKEYPEVGVPLIDTYTELLTTDATRVRNNALASLTDLAAEYPEEVIEASDTYIELLDDDDQLIRANATSIIARLARRDPSIVSSATSSLVDRLEDDHPPTRQNACWALGRLNVASARGRLEDLRKNDPADAVRAGAIAALTLIDRSQCPRCEEHSEPHDVKIAVVFPERVRWTCPHCDRTTIDRIEY